MLIQIINSVASAIIGGAIVWKYKNLIIADITAEKNRLEAAKNTAVALQAKAISELDVLRAKVLPFLGAANRASAPAPAPTPALPVTPPAPVVTTPPTA